VTAWSNVHLGEIAKIVRGVTYSKGDVIQSPTSSDIPILRAGNINGRLITDHDLVWLPRGAVNDEQLLRRNDIVMCMSSGSATIVGKSAILDRDWRGSFGAFCAAIRADPLKAEAGFLAHILAGAEFRIFASSAQGNNIKNLNKSALEGYCIPLPPLDEQRRIVGLLDRAGAIRRSANAARAKTRATIPALFLDTFGDPASNPKRWPTIAFSDAIRVRSGNFLPAKAMATDGVFPVYGGNGINGYHSEYMFEQEMIVIGRVGAYCGNVHISRPRSWITDNALYISKYSPTFLQAYLAIALRYARLGSRASQAGQPLISAGRLASVPLLVPPMGLQTAFAKQVHRLEAIAQHLDAAAAKADAMAASLSAQVFE
jgi:type I restriction enzyme S subunit